MCMCSAGALCLLLASVWDISVLVSVFIYCIVAYSWDIHFFLGLKEYITFIIFLA